MPGSGAAGLRAEPYLKGQALVRGESGTGRKAGETEARAGRGDAADGDVNVAGVLESDVLRVGGLKYLITEADRGWRHLQGGEGFFRDTGERDRSRAVRGSAGDLNCSCGISSDARFKRQRVIHFLSRQNRAWDGRAGERKLGTLEGHGFEGERSGAGVGDVESLCG